MRLRMLVVAAVTSLALVAVGVPVASAANGTSKPPKVTSIAPLYKLPVSGAAKNGKKFSGTYAIQRFVVKSGKVYSVGTLKGRLKGRKVTRYGVMIPASLKGGANGAQTSQATCQVLHLVLGPINLNLLGLRITLGGGPNANLPIVLDITAVRGGGILGDLLCGLTDSLSGTLGQLNGQLQQLAATLNSLISLLGGLQGA
jgi:hypothetical protein